MMNLKQLSIVYDQREDRLLLRLNSADDMQLRLWVTRYMCRAVLRMLLTAEREEVPEAAQRTPEAAGAVQEFLREHCLAEQDFSTPFKEDAAQLPLGDGPVLVIGAAMAWGSDERSLRFDLPDDGVIQFALERVLVHGLIKMLLDGAQLADWNLEGVKPAAGEQDAGKRGSFH